MVKAVCAFGVVILARLISDTDPIHNDVKSRRSDSKISKKNAKYNGRVGLAYS